MNKGFKITCLNCGEEMIIDEDYASDKDDSGVTVTIMSARSSRIFLTCAKCTNDIEKEI